MGSLQVCRLPARVCPWFVRVIVMCVCVCVCVCVVCCLFSAFWCASVGPTPVCCGGHSCCNVVSYGLFYLLVALTHWWFLSRVWRGKIEQPTGEKKKTLSAQNTIHVLLCVWGVFFLLRRVGCVVSCVQYIRAVVCISILC